MKISQEIEQAINDQIQMEFSSAYAYLSMAAYFESLAWNGFAHWMHLQRREEDEHAMRFYNYLHDRGGCVTLKALGEPPRKFSSPLDAFEKSLAQEQKVTASIHALYDLAAKEGDHATASMLKWFVDEQVEEEKSVGDMVDRIRLAGDHPGALLLLDREAGSRSAE